MMTGSQSVCHRFSALSISNFGFQPHVCKIFLAFEGCVCVCCILAVAARDARAPRGHNWSYNQLKATLLLPPSFFGHLPLRTVVTWKLKRWPCHSTIIIKTWKLMTFQIEEDKKAQIKAPNNKTKRTKGKENNNKKATISIEVTIIEWRSKKLGQWTHIVMLDTCLKLLLSDLRKNVVELNMVRADNASSVGYFLSPRLQSASLCVPLQFMRRSPHFYITPCPPFALVGTTLSCLRFLHFH